MTTRIDINSGNTKQALLGLVIALIEIIRDALRLQAIRRMDSGKLTAEEVERLGLALEEMDNAIEKMKDEQGVTESVRSIRSSLDELANNLVNEMVDRDAGRNR